MALLRWTELSWDEFVTGLEGFRDHYSGKSREDETYVGCLALMQSRPLQARASGRELVDFLNQVGMPALLSQDARLDRRLGPRSHDPP